jgi:hypothetical protein
VNEFGLVFGAGQSPIQLIGLGKTKPNPSNKTGKSIKKTNQHSKSAKLL